MHAYPLTPFWRFYIVLVFLLALGLGGLFVWLSLTVPMDAPTRAICYVSAGLLALLGWAVLILGWRIRLIVSQDGLSMVALGYTVRAGWRQVIGYNAVPGCQGLALRDPAVEQKPWFSVMLKLSQPVALLNLLLGRYQRVPDPLGERTAECLPIQAFAQDYPRSARPWQPGTAL
jgi:hypothetical protein